MIGVQITLAGGIGAFGTRFMLTVRNCCRKQGIGQVGACPVEYPARHFLQADPGAHDGVPGNGVADRQGAQGDPVR